MTIRLLASVAALGAVLVAGAVPASAEPCGIAEADGSKAKQEMVVGVPEGGGKPQVVEVEGGPSRSVRVVAPPSAAVTAVGGAGSAGMPGAPGTPGR